MRHALLFLLCATALAVPARAEPLVEGHSAHLLTTGRNSFRERNANIRNADVVLLKTYAFLDDDTGREMIASLVAAAKAGKQVIVEFDVKGTSHNPLELLGNVVGIGSSIPRHLRPLVEAGVTVIPTNRPRLGSMLLGRDHDKLLVTWKDGQPAKVIMGGMNIGNTYAWSGRWQAQKRTLAFRDTDVSFSGPEVAKVIDRIVEAAGRVKPGAETMAKITRAASSIAAARGAFDTSAPHDSGVRFVVNDPKYGPNARAIEALYERLIDETPTGETITMANAYTHFSKRVENRLVSAMTRGVKVHLYVNSTTAEEGEASHVALAFHDQLRGLYKRVPRHALEVTEFAGDAHRNEGSMHQKIARFGAKGPVVVGSHNHDSLSANYNSEAVAVVTDRRVGQQFEGLMNRMRREGKTRTLDRATLRRDSFATKVKGFLLNRVAGRVL